jgi:micrococcal nuclease
MQILIVLLAWTLATTATSRSTPATPASAQRSDAVLVRSVLDGDTIDVAGVGRVRLLGIDAPERAHGLDTAAPFANEAREKLISLVLHRWVRLEADVEKLDGYNRHLAYVVREDGLFVNAELVRDGLARVSARLRLARLAELKRAEAEAQRARRGMWGQAPDVHAPGYTRRRRSNP